MDQSGGWTPWTDLEIPDADFDIAALHSAIDERRRERQMSWKAVAREIADAHPATHRVSSGDAVGPLAAQPCRIIDENRPLVALGRGGHEGS